MIARHLLRLGFFSKTSNIIRMSSSSNKYLNMSVDFKDENGKEYAEISMPGFSFTDYDRTGNVAPWNLQKLFAGYRMKALEMTNPNTNEPFLQISKFWNDHLVFYVSCSMDWEKDFYLKGALLNSMKQLVRPGYVGSSSYNTLNKMYHGTSGKLLASCVSQLVLVSRQTRRPIALPDWWRDHYGKMMPESPSLKIDILKTPEHTINYPLKVAWSDADRYRHTNMAVYIRFCMDAGATASLEGKLKHFSGDLANVPLRRIESAYKGESRPGEELIVKTWEQVDKDDTIHFQIFKGDNVLFQSTAVYFRDLHPIKPAVDENKEREPVVNPIYPEKHHNSKY